MIFATHAYGILGAAWAHFAVAFGIVLPGYAIALRGSGVRIAELIHAAWWPTVVALPVVAVALVANFALDEVLPALLAGGTGALVVYGLLMRPWLRRRIADMRGTGAQVSGEE